MTSEPMIPRSSLEALIATWRESANCQAGLARMSKDVVYRETEEAHARIWTRCADDLAAVLLSLHTEEKEEDTRVDDGLR